MNHIRWDHRFLMGNKAIDEEHEKLFYILNKLITAFNEKHTDKVIDDIFNSLEEYTFVHFKTEELLMQKYQYEHLKEHKNKHKEFIDKVKLFKEELNSTTPKYVAKQMIDFLSNWLISHIIKDDFLLIDLAKKEQKEKEASLFKFFSNILEKRFTIDARTKISIIIPTIGMIFFSSFLLFNYYLKYIDTQQIFMINSHMKNINSLSHNLQIERGFSSAYVSSTDTKFFNKLKEHRVKTNNEIYKYSSNISFDTKELIGLRKRVDNKSINNKEVLNSYTKIIQTTLSSIDNLLKFNVNSKIEKEIQSLFIIAKLKDSVGFERGLISSVIEKGKFSKEEYLDFIRLSGEQKGYFNEFTGMAKSKQIKRFNTIINKKIPERIENFEKILIDKEWENDLSEFDTNVWFNTVSLKINKLKILIDELIQDIDKNTLLESNQVKQNFIVVLIVTILILITTIILSFILRKSIIEPIEKLSRDIEQLATRDNSFEPKEFIKDDELQNILNMYERSRQIELQNDLEKVIEINKKNEELKYIEESCKELEELASKDTLTKVYNRRKLKEVAKKEIDRVKRYNNDLSLLMIDLDHFKIINDTYGHQVGDRVLIEFSQLCMNILRECDTVARVGGEEFVILLRETNLEKAKVFANRLLQKVSNSSLSIDDITLNYTVSIGVFQFDKNSMNDISDLIKKADIALYQAKNKGRNRVC